MLSYTVAEALWLEQAGVSDDIVVAYPSVDRGAIARMLASPTAVGRITLMVDAVEHLDVIDAVRGSGSGSAEVRVALDIDAGLHLPGTHLGPKRSPLHDADAVVALAHAIVTRPGVPAGRRDDLRRPRSRAWPTTSPGSETRSFAVRRVKAASVSQLARRRARIVAALRGLTRLEFWNAGGSGSLETSAADPVVTEVTAGSGLLVPTLFDHYRSFAPRPAAYFGLPVTRRPGSGMVTVHGGG